MSVPHFEPPAFNKPAFNCPHCGAFAHQSFSPFESRRLQEVDRAGLARLEEFKWSLCTACKQVALWIGHTLVYPVGSDAPPPSPDMPPDVADDYSEASAVLTSSPRAAAALLRLAIQKLMKHLGQSGNNINDDIAALVRDGLRPKVQQALDIVRVVGNNAVHPGELDVRDNPAVALSLFKCVNLIVEQTITQPKEMRELFATLPQKDQDNIRKRDTASHS